MNIEWFKSVRSIATIILILTYATLCIRGEVKAQDLQVVVAMIITFYFAGKHRGGTNGQVNGGTGSN